ncbi:MAG TPA: peptidoglycan bridge formation glycyltransferase FemA/FemB family protein [Candidatus Saccharimonadales bacterium]|nr:peptidoglycan bridge formation glycyltransferase FemA/FemB family protein [Candidatus Saccharimonadales bacterium]
MSDLDKLRFESVDDKSYNKIIQSHPSRSWPIEQSPAWGDFQSRLGGRRHIGNFVLYSGEEVVATASLLAMSMRGYSYVWINNGPIILNDSVKTDVLIEAVKTLVRRHTTDLKPLFIRLSLPVEQSPTKALKPAYSHSLLEKTTAIDLNLSEEGILAGMKQGARRSIRKAEKAGVSIKHFSGDVALEQFSSLYDIMEETAGRDGFSAHPAKAYEAMLKELGDLARLYVGYNSDNHPVTWAIVTQYQHKAIYYYGASNAEARAIMAPYLMHWQIMKDMKASGCKSYDFLGIGSDKYPGLEGVTQFKLKFGGPVLDYPSVYDLPLNSAKYKLWRTAQAARHKLKH